MSHACLTARGRVVWTVVIPAYMYLPAVCYYQMQSAAVCASSFSVRLLRGAVSRCGIKAAVHTFIGDASMQFMKVAAVLSVETHAAYQSRQLC